MGIWLFVFAILLASQAGFYFYQPHFELGDLAVNALQIRDAKSFTELYGNYSRWHFHHPGPAFFYAYAFGEWLLFDLTHLVPSPYNAHVLIGLLLQTFFFAWAITIVKRRVGNALIVPVILLLAGAHFTVVNCNFPESAFRSIWTPHVLLFPFLCFVVACASVASGAGKDLIPATLAGSLLVHGHVAQPLFVAPLFALAYLSLVLRQKERRGLRGIAEVFRAFRREHLIAASIIALFLVPLVLDALKGEGSNLNAILRHFETHKSDRKSAGSSLLYLASYLCYIPEPEKYVDLLTASSWKFLSHRWYFFGIWMALLAATIFLSVRDRRKTYEGKAFTQMLWPMFAIALLLTFAWGILQNGSMYNFNSFFNFALLFVVPILFAIGACNRLPHSNRKVVVGLYLAAIPLLVLCAGSGTLRQKSADPAEIALRREVEQAAAAGGPTIKFLSFEPTDWPWVAGVALALQRFGSSFAVNDEWGFMFGKKHVLDARSALQSGNATLWKTQPAASGLPGFPLLHGRIMATSPPLLDPNGAELTFCGANPSARTYTVFGWDITEGEYSWSNAKTAMIYFKSTAAPSEITMTLDVFPGVFPTVPKQRMSVSCNGEPAQWFDLSEAQKLTVRIPSEVWNREAIAMICFEFPDAVSPAALGVSADTRTLGYAFKRINFQSGPSSP